MNLILAGSDRILRMCFSDGAPASIIRILLLTEPTGGSVLLSVQPRSGASNGRLPTHPKVPAVARCRCRSPVPVHHCPRERQIGCRCTASLTPSSSDAELHGVPALRTSLRLLKVLPTLRIWRGEWGAENRLEPW